MAPSSDYVLHFLDPLVVTRSKESSICRQERRDQLSLDNVHYMKMWLLCVFIMFQKVNASVHLDLSILPVL